MLVDSVVVSILMKTYLIPTPPAMKTIFRTPSKSTPSGGQTKLPPTRIPNSAPKISSLGFQNHALAGFAGAYCTASSTNGALPCASTTGTPISLYEPNPSAVGAGCSSWGRTVASAGVDVILKPPAFEMDGICTSSHCPGRKVSGWGVWSSCYAVNLCLQCIYVGVLTCPSCASSSVSGHCTCGGMVNWNRRTAGLTWSICDSRTAYRQFWRGSAAVRIW